MRHACHTSAIAETVQRVAQKNGPAEAATSPSRGSTNPAKDMAMNTRTDSTAAAGATIPDSLKLPNPAEISVNLEALSECSMHELWLLRRGFNTLANVVDGLMFNSLFGECAEAVLSPLQEFLCVYESAVQRIAKQAKPDELARSDVAWRAWILLGYEADCADDLPLFAVMAAEAARDETDAILRERRVA